MKRSVILLLLGCLISVRAQSQSLHAGMHYPDEQFGNAIYFDALPDSHNVLFGNIIRGIYVPDDAVYRIFSKDVSTQKLSSSIALGIKLDPKLSFYALAPVQSFSRTFPAFRLKGKSAAIVIAMGINKSNVNSYRYRVVLNDSVEIIHWSPIPKLEQQYGAKVPYGFIGNFNYSGKRALIEVMNIDDYNLRSGAVFDWRKDFKPFVFAVIGNASPQKSNQTIDFNVKKDTVTRKVLKINCVQGTTGSLSLYLRQHPGIAYASSITREENGKLLYSAQGEPEDIEGAIKFNVDTLTAGKYKLTIYPKVEGHMSIPGQDVNVELNLTPPPKSTSILEKKASFKQLLPYLLGAVLITVLFFVFYRRQANIKLARSIQARQNVNLKMRSIRAQLNPHFMFNALTSIQNLVNKKDMEGANHYLSRFANLTRKVLNTGEKELISLEDELKLLDDYLQMEQLRFGFQYRIEPDASVNMANTEVPAMLLQPFVENAVKHGVSDLRERGEIAVIVCNENNNLNLIITDNGVGFKPRSNQDGGSSFGLKLSEERIELLNQLYAGNPFSLSIDSNADGTTVTVKLKDWIS